MVVIVKSDGMVRFKYIGNGVQDGLQKKSISKLALRSPAYYPVAKSFQDFNIPWLLQSLKKFLMSNS